MVIDPNRSELRAHVNSTYVSLRYGICLLGFSLPIVLIVGGGLIGWELQDSISQYYHTPLRDLFVGSLFGIGAFLYLYKGFSRRENLALNISGLALVCVALFPISINEENAARLESYPPGVPVANKHHRLRPEAIIKGTRKALEIGQWHFSEPTSSTVESLVLVPDGKEVSRPLILTSHPRQQNQLEELVEPLPDQQHGHLRGGWTLTDIVHILSALIFFFAIAFVCIRSASDTLYLIPDLRRRAELEARYWLLGVMMIVVPSSAALLGFFDFCYRYYVVFMVEWAAILVFSAYWWIKSREFKDLLDVPEVLVCER
jgi:hypothetical protein